MSWRYFTEAEMACKCGCGQAPMDDDFMRKLDAMRFEAGFPFTITSGYRCPDHNDRVSSSGRTGAHTTGRAADIGVDRGKAYIVLGLALKFGMTGIGVSQKGDSRFLHVDDIDDGVRPTVWSY